MGFEVFLITIVLGSISGYVQHGPHSSRLKILAGTASLSSFMLFISAAMAQELYAVALALVAVFVLSHLLGYVSFWAAVVRQKGPGDDRDA